MNCKATCLNVLSAILVISAAAACRAQTIVYTGQANDVPSVTVQCAGGQSNSGYWWGAYYASGGTTLQSPNPQGWTVSLGSGGQCNNNNIGHNTTATVVITPPCGAQTTWVTHPGWYLYMMYDFWDNNATTTITTENFQLLRGVHCSS